MSEEILRFTHGRVCPICQGSDNEPRSHGVRCHGFLRDKWAFCSREEYAGKAQYYPQSGTWKHKVQGKCPCGVQHAARDRVPGAEIAAIYQYHDARGNVLFEVVRYRNPKGFKQRRPIEGGKYAWNLNGVEPVLFHLHALAGADPGAPVWIVEGEKDAQQISSLGLLATCNPMGAGKWRDSYAASLIGRTCFIIPDNDQVGREHAQQVAQSLHGKAAAVKIVELPGLLEHGDVSDFLVKGTVAELVELADQASEWSPPPAPSDAKTAHVKEEGKLAPKDFQSHADTLLKLSRDADLFKTPSGDGYCSFTVNGRVEHHPVGSQAVVDWLVCRFLEETDKAPSADVLNQILTTMRAKARHSTSVIPVGIRVGTDPLHTDPLWPVYWLDLGNERGQVIRISAAGWELREDSPVRFRRPKGMIPLPIPQRGGSLDLLWKFCNVEEADRILLKAALTHSLLPVKPQPIQVLAGEQGSCKSTLTEILKRCVDPRRPMLGSPPGDVRDMAIIANNTWVLAFDNLTIIRPWLSDMLCRLAYGVGFETRTLRTDDELTSFESCRPIIINGIDDLVTRLDLLSRAVILNCPTINDDDRRADDEFWLAFEADHPLILGALLDAIAGGLALLPKLERLTLPRMAAFGRWGEAVSRHLGHAEGEFLDAFLSNQQSSAAELLEDSPLVSELTAMGRSHADWTGTASELLDTLNDRANAVNRSNAKWPRGSRSLSCQLKRLAPGLRKQGINVTFAPRLNKSRLIAIAWRSDGGGSPPSYARFASLASLASPPENGASRLPLTQTPGNKEVPF